MSTFGRKGGGLGHESEEASGAASGEEVMAKDTKADTAGSDPEPAGAAVARRARRTREIRREVDSIGEPNDRYERLLRGILLEKDQRREPDEE